MKKRYIILMSAAVAFIFYLSVLYAVMVLAHFNYVQTDSYKIVHATDFHYYSPSLTDYGKAFQRKMASGDGKLVQYSPQITDAFVEAMIEEQPDLVALTGDLAFMGETVGHKELAGKLKRIEDAGIPVIVIPGNHDINSEKAKSYRKDQSVQVDSPDEEGFVEIYRDFGYGEAIARHKKSLSYVYALSEDTWILAVDANGYDARGKVKASTVRWIRKQMKEARKNDINVISISHQNLRRHNRTVNDIYTMGRANRLLAIYHRYGVHFNLSGHMHVQHYRGVRGITDLACESILMPPSQYAVIEEDGYHFHYEKRSLNLPNIDQYKLFEQVSRSQMESDFTQEGMSKERQKELIPQLIEINKQYFAGHVTDLERAKALLQTLREEAPDSRWRTYLEGIVEDQGQDFTHFSETYDPKKTKEEN